MLDRSESLRIDFFFQEKFRNVPFFNVFCNHSVLLRDTYRFDEIKSLYIVAHLLTVITITSSTISPMTAQIQICRCNKEQLIAETFLAMGRQKEKNCGNTSIIPFL